MENELKEELHGLLDKILEVKDGYEQSAKDSNDREIQNILREIADQKVKDALEIKNILESHSQTVPNLEALSNERTAGTKGLQSLFTDKGEKSIIEHCIVDEKTLAEKYKSVLSKDYADEATKSRLRYQLARSYYNNTSLWAQSVRFKSFMI